MLAAESLFAEKGLANVSVRAIVGAAGQRNESALHYHFGGREGLIAALHELRSQQLGRERMALAEKLVSNPETFDLRTMAAIMVRPAFQLAGRDSGYRNYLKVFAHLVLFSSSQLAALIAKSEDGDIRETHRVLQELCPQLDAALVDTRIENATRFATLALSQRAREGGSFRGKRAEFFINDLVDTVAAMLAAEPSGETLALLASSRSGGRR